MPVPDYQSLMLPVLKAVAERQISSADLRDQVASELQLSEADLAELLPSGRQTIFANRVAWANVYLQKAGLIRIVSRGVYEITDAGQAALKQKPAAITNKFLEQFPAYREWQERSAAEQGEGAPQNAGGAEATGITSTNPEEQIDRSHRELLAAVEADVLARLQAVSPTQFESVIVDLLVAMGYGGGRPEMAKALGRSGDNGVDGVVREDKLGLDVVYMQAKRYDPSHNVGPGEVRDFVGALEGHRATKGVFVTTSGFAKSALQYVERVSKRVVLIDGQELARLMVQHGVGVRIRARYEISEIDEEYFSV